MRTLVFISSDSGSAGAFRAEEDGFGAYAMSKAALNQGLRVRHARFLSLVAVTHRSLVTVPHPVSRKRRASIPLIPRPANDPLGST